MAATGFGTPRQMFSPSASTPGTPRHDMTAAGGMPSARLLEEHFTRTIESDEAREAGASYNPMTKSRRRSSVLNSEDSMSMHLLVETAIYDSNSCAVLSFSELESLKKELEHLTTRIDAAKRKLALETKVRDAALSLSRLNNRKGRRKPSIAESLPATPETPGKTEEELAVSARKCDELCQELWKLSNRQNEIQKKLLEHNAGILGATHGKPTSKGQMQFPMQTGGSYTLANGTMSPLTEEFDDRSLYRTPGDLFGGRQSPDTAEVLQKVEELNARLADLLLESAHKRGLPMPMHLQVDAGNGVKEQLKRLEENIEYIQQNPPSAPGSERGGRGGRGSTESMEQTETTLRNLWEMMIMGEDEIRGLKRRRQAEGYDDPPSDDEDGDEEREYTLPAFSAKLQRLFAKAMDLRTDRDAMKEQLQKQHETISHANTQMDGLLNKLAETQQQMKLKDAEIAEIEQQIKLKEAELAETQQQMKLKDVELARLVSQDAEKRMSDDRKSSEESASREHDALALAAERKARTELEEEYDQRLREKEDAYTDLAIKLQETQEDRDMAKIELEALTAEHAEKFKELEAEISALKESAQEAEKVKELEYQLKEKDSQIGKLDEEVKELSAKVAEMSMELVMAKADLDSVQGSKSQRAQETAEAKAAAAALLAASQKPQTIDPTLLEEIEELHKRNQELIDEILVLKNERAEGANSEHLQKRCKDLQNELDGMLGDFQMLTQQGIEMERERGKLEGLIDELRDRCEELETLLNEERLKGLGRQGSVGGEGIGGLKSPGFRGESTSTGVLKEQFKKMMRDMRAEQAKALRAEQEERRKLEGLIRQMKREQISVPVRRGTQATIHAQSPGAQ